MLIAGDFVYQAAHDPAGAIGLAVELVGPLPAGSIPTYAVLGNHDYATESDEPRARQRQIARQLERALETAGVQVLRNEAVALPPPAPTSGEPPLYLVGVGEPAAGDDHPLQAIHQVPADAPRIVLMHNPDSFPDLPPGSAPLALAGHTHGGQIRVPFKKDWGPARLLEPWPQYVDGWLEDFGQPGNRLYINRGIGFSKLPLRFGCRPELTLFTLRRPAS